MSESLQIEEWGFFVEKKEHLKQKFRKKLWIPDHEVGFACDYEYTRTNFQKGSEICGWGFDEEEFKEMMKKPFLNLKKAEKQRIQKKRLWRRGLFGNEGLQLFKDENTAPVSEWTYWVHINWLLHDDELVDSLRHFLKRKRPKDFPNPPIAPKFRTDRDRLKFLAAYRLRSFATKTKLMTLAAVIDEVQEILNFAAVKNKLNPFYRSRSSLIAAADKAEDELNTLFRFSSGSKLPIQVDMSSTKGYSTGKTHKVFIPKKLDSSQK